MANVKKVFGPPGTGKTTYLLNRVEEALAAGIKPQEIGFFSFTVKAAEEARFRAISKFPNFHKDEFQYFRTLHSLALDTIGGASNNSTMGKEDWNNLGENLGLSFTGSSSKLQQEVLVWDGATAGDKIRSLCDLARLRGVPVEKAWLRSDIEGVTLDEIKRFQKTLTLYKQTRGMIDFCDMLELAAKSSSLPSYKLLIVDEAQDLSSLQWDLVTKLVEKAHETYIAGDDDQAIFQWAGADTARYLAFEGDTIILNKSYRVPYKVWQVARRLQRSIKDRVEKLYEPRGEDGGVTRHVEFNPDRMGLGEGEWLILVRNNYQIKPFVDGCVEHGLWFSCKLSSIRPNIVPAVAIWERLRKGETVTKSEALQCYTFLGTRTSVAHGGKATLSESEWERVNLVNLKEAFGLLTESPWFQAFDGLTLHEVRYLRACRKRNEKLLKEPRIKISTIHGAKGGEADNVLLAIDYSRNTDRAAQDNPSDEHRVWYVAVTRARKSLHILLPQTNTYFKPLCQTP